MIINLHDATDAFALTIEAALAIGDGADAAKKLAGHSEKSGELRDLIRMTRQCHLGRVCAEDGVSSLRVLAELDILNAYDRIRICYRNIGDTLLGAKV